MDEHSTDAPEPAATTTDPASRRVSPFWRATAIVLALAVAATAWWSSRQAGTRRQQLSNATLGLSNRAERLGDAAFRAPVERATHAWDLALAELEAARALAAQPDADPMWNDKIDALADEFGKAREKSVETAKAHDRNRELVARLEEARIPTATNIRELDWLEEQKRIDRAYREGIGDPQTRFPGTSDELRAQVSQAVANRLASVLDHWALVERAIGTKSPAVQPATTTRIDGDHKHRRELRDALAKNTVDLEVLRRLHRDFDYLGEPAASARLIADALAAAGDIETAIASYEGAALGHPDDFVTHVALGVLCERVTPPRHERAMAAYSSALALRPDSAATRRRLGIVLLARSQPSAALELFEHELRQNREDASLLRLVARAAHAAKNWNRAITVYERLLRQSKDDPVLLTELADVHLDKGDTFRAALRYREVCALRPKDRDSWQRLGNALSTGPDPDPAIAELQKANAIEPRADTWIAIAKLQIAAERGQEAVDSLANAIRLAPDSDRAHFLLGAVRAQQGDWKGAVASYRRALDANPAHMDATLRAAELFRDHGHYVESLSLFRRVHALGQRMGSAWKQPSGAWVREAEELAKQEQRLLPLIEGTATAQFVSDWLAAIDYAIAREAYVPVVGMFERVASIHPMIVDASDRPREKAARAALLALAGKGTGTLADPAATRRRALSWLNAELEFWGKEIGRDIAVLKNRAQNRLEAWSTSPDFEVVRSKRLDALPAEEAASWRKFWDEVERLMRIE